MFLGSFICPRIRRRSRDLNERRKNILEAWESGELIL
jgi:hypothetical protein